MVSLRGIRAAGRHGANPGERDEPQEFVVDVDVWVRVASDSLSAALDYRGVAAAVRLAVEESSHELLESLAEEVALAVARVGRALRVRAAVHKPSAATSLGVDDVSAQFTLEG